MVLSTFNCVSPKVFGLLVFSLGFGGSLYALHKGLETQKDVAAVCIPGPLPQQGVLYSNNALELPLCHWARVTLILEGTVAKGQGPWAMVVEGKRILWQGEVRQRRKVVVQTSGDGIMALVFTNDYYQPPVDRNLFLQSVGVEPLLHR